jgi:hypothetical protein
MLEKVDLIIFDDCPELTKEQLDSLFMQIIPIPYFGKTGTVYSTYPINKMIREDSNA